MAAGAPTIHDVAQAAGVSISTVSRALSRPERVNGVTREGVLRAAAALGYQPSPHARSLLSGRSWTVMLLVPDVTNPFYFGLIRGVQRRAAEAGYRQVVVDTDESPAVEADQLRAARKSVDGVVLAASRLTDAQLGAAAAQVPLVTINRSAPGVPAVVIDTPAAIRQAVGYLADLGHRDIAYLGGPAASWSDGRRWQAVQRAARVRGLRGRRLGRHAPTREAGQAAAAEVLADGAGAVLTYNDLQAIGLLAGLRAAGAEVPADLSVVGCDDIFGADFCSPPLTTVAAPVERAGRLATERLLDQLGPDRASPDHRRPARPDPAGRVPARLVVRASTGPPPRRPAPHDPDAERSHPTGGRR